MRVFGGWATPAAGPKRVSVSFKITGKSLSKQRSLTRYALMKLGFTWVNGLPHLDDKKRFTRVFLWA